MGVRAGAWRARRPVGADRAGRRSPAPRRLAALLAASAVLASGVGCDRLGHLRQRVGTALGEGPPPLEPAAPPRSVHGRLALSLHGPGGGAPAVVHRSTWVRGPGYDGMEDNDLRGFLDGRFIYGWNQPGQVHTRLGRRGSSPRWGEPELFRTLHRWAKVRLPAGARVRDAELAVHVEDGPDRPLDVLLYAVRGDDWQPGRGGAPRHNNAPPEAGDVWWGARAEAEEPWGLPGVGYAAPDPDADTPAEPLAEARWEPGDERLAFRSSALARYAERRATRGAPLLFLLKLSDPLEDLADTVLAIRSASVDDLRNPTRRPRLTLEWEDPAPRARRAREVHLEPGRALALPRLEVGPDGARLAAASFEAAPGHEAPTVQVRGGRGGAEPSAWRVLDHPRPVDWDWMEARVLAARRPLPLGEAFTTRLRNTWVRSAPPETQRVPFTFVSPQGARTTVPADYEGDWTWTVRFRPDELGRWRYAYETSFLKRPERSAVGSFDVVALDREDVRRGLERLLARARAAAEDGEPAGGMSELARQFWKLERAALRLETPEHWRSEEGRALYALLTEVRASLSGRRVPDEARKRPMERTF
ncbi:MAG: DUF5060 domain-containing protein [Myxococcota bacterium]|nr:DUF5060 domain-containing protein [Myxococcota bacterium]